MKRTMTLLALTVAVLTANAQSVTYNHDAAKQNQITVMETGGGVLTPDFYYWLLHNGYKKTAAAKNKLGFRTAAGLALYKQVDDAAQIDSALTKRAEVEALNMADRQIDLARRPRQRDMAARRLAPSVLLYNPFHPSFPLIAYGKATDYTQQQAQPRGAV